MSKRIRLELVIDKKVDIRFDRWATEIACDKAEVLLRALQLYDVAPHAHQIGERLAKIERRLPARTRYRWHLKDKSDTSDGQMDNLIPFEVCTSHYLSQVQGLLFVFHWC